MNILSAKTHINLKVKRLIERKIDKAIADFYNNFVMSMVNQHGGSIRKQSFWKVKRVLAPKSITVLHSVTDGFGNEITDVRQISEVSTRMSLSTGYEQENRWTTKGS